MLRCFPSPLPLAASVLQLDPIALCCPGNQLSSEEKLRLSEAPRFPALPAYLSVGRKKGGKSSQMGLRQPHCVPIGSQGQGCPEPPWMQSLSPYL